MNPYEICCESSIDLSKERFSGLNLQCIHYEIDLGENHYTDDFFQSFSDTDFYERMLKGEMTHTSALNVSEYLEFWRPFLEEGKDIIHLTLSSALTSGYRNACLAREEAMEEFPDRKVAVIDSISACGGYGLLMIELSQFKAEGRTWDEMVHLAEETKMKVQHLFFSTDLQFYVRGGRISKAAGTFAKALQICPLCDMDDLGYLVVREKIRLKEKVKQRMVDRFFELVDKGMDYTGPILLNQSYCEEDALDVKRRILERQPAFEKQIEIFPLGPTIGAHTGPFTVALFFLSKEGRPEHKEA